LETGKGKTKEAIAPLSEQGVEILEIDYSTIWAIFYLHIKDEDSEKTIEVFKRL